MLEVGKIYLYNINGINEILLITEFVNVSDNHARYSGFMIKEKYNVVCQFSADNFNYKPESFIDVTSDYPIYSFLLNQIIGV